MARSYGVGIVGMGWVSGEYIKAFRAEPRAEVTALCSRSRQKAEQRIADYSLAARPYDDYEAMLADPRVDIVAICTPDNLHAALAIKAAFELISPYIMNFDLLGTQATLRDNTIPTIIASTAEVTHHPFGQEVAHFLDCIANDAESHASLHRALNSHETCFAAEMSARDGKPVRVEELRAQFSATAV